MVTKVGKMSYSFYLIHYIVLTRVAKLIDLYSINRGVVLFFVLFFSIVLTYIMYWSIEVWLGKVLRNVLKVK